MRLNLLSVSFLLFLVFWFPLFTISAVLTIEFTVHCGEVTVHTIILFHVLSGHNWRKTGSIFIVMLMLLVLLATRSRMWLQDSVGKLQLIFE